MRAGRRPTKHTALKNMEKEPGELLAAQAPLMHQEDTGAQPIQSISESTKDKKAISNSESPLPRALCTDQGD